MNRIIASGFQLHLQGGRQVAVEEGEGKKSQTDQMKELLAKYGGTYLAKYADICTYI
jgi:hypothetical protein